MPQEGIGIPRIIFVPKGVIDDIEETIKGVKQRIDKGASPVDTKMLLDMIQESLDKLKAHYKKPMIMFQADHNDVRTTLTGYGAYGFPNEVIVHYLEAMQPKKVLHCK